MQCYAVGCNVCMRLSPIYLSIYLSIYVYIYICLYIVRKKMSVCMVWYGTVWYGTVYGIWYMVYGLWCMVWYGIVSYRIALYGNYVCMHACLQVFQLT